MAKILVIDDEPSFRVLLDLLLRRKGYDMLFADNGWDGLQLYRREHPDVILLDLKMPGLDGVAVLNHIRSVDLKQPVIILTGDTSPAAAWQVCGLGVSEFIMKGSSLHSLGDVLERILKTPALEMATHQ